MAKLVLSKGGSVLHQCFIEKDRIGVGRDGHNHVVVDDPAVGGEHAAIVPIGNDHVLEDLDSPAGTVVNGIRVDRHILQHGDVIELGSFFLRYLNPRLASTIDLERTMLIAGLKGLRDASRESPSPDAARIAATRPGKVRFPRGVMRVLEGMHAGSVVELDRVVTTLGTRGDRLAVLTRRPQGYFITHVEGRRHPRINGQLMGKEARLLRSGDVIEVGDDKVEFLQG